MTSRGNRTTCLGLWRSHDPQPWLCSSNNASSVSVQLPRLEGAWLSSACSNSSHIEAMSQLGIMKGAVASVTLDVEHCEGIQPCPFGHSQIIDAMWKETDVIAYSSELCPSIGVFIMNH
jgi:hypothetical protein